MINKFIKEHKLSFFLALVIIWAIILVSISMAIYYRTEAYLLDLSRPEYQSMRSKIHKENKTNDLFNAQGAIDEQTLDDFLERYKKEAQKATTSESFYNDVLSDKQLGLE